MLKNSQKSPLIQKKAVTLHAVTLKSDMMDVITLMRQQGGYITTKDIGSRAMYDQLLSEVERSNVVRVRTGLYALPDEMAKPMVDIRRLIPGGVICMFTAWEHYDLTTKLPLGICVAIEKNRKVRLPDYPPIMLYYWTQNVFELGVSEAVIDGYDLKIYDMEKSVCDAVKFRNKIGLDVSSEILKNYLRRSDRNLERLHDYAKKMRIDTTLSSLISYLL